MTSVRMDRLAISVAEMGPRSRVSSLDAVEEIDARIDASIPSSITKNIAYGRVSSIIPYRMWNDYGRDRTVQSLPVAVIENSHLRATFLTSLGGRLWSIYDKTHARELLYQSPAIQPTNLALTNAWFPGGVEWNISTIGHSPLGFDPVHVGVCNGPDGTPALRMYEFERLRETPFQIDAYLPDDSRFLFIHVRIRNPNAWIVPIYWWSNIAVPEHAHTRVVAPADTAFLLAHHVEMSLSRVALTPDNGIDPSYPALANESASYYFDISRERQPWIAALDAEGNGLLHTSTARLAGRKFFTWGRSRGGERWQSFLSEPGHPYLEIQAGLTQTQLEHVPLPAETSWSWLEAFGSCEIDGTAAHGPWDLAAHTVGETVRRALPISHLQVIEERLVGSADSPLVETLQAGSGWGALEEERRRRMSEPSLASEGVPFPSSSIGPEQAPWMALLETGTMPSADPDRPPAADVARGWEELLEASPPTWLSRLQLGVIRYGAGDWTRARAAWEDSLRQRETAWAWRALAMLDRRENDLRNAVEGLERAALLAPEERQLTIELIQTLIDAGEPQEALARLEALPQAEQRHGRITLLEIRAALAVGDLDRASAIFATDFVVPDLREGDLVLEETWYELQVQLEAHAADTTIDDDLRERIRRERPVPANYDFRMAPS